MFAVVQSFLHLQFKIPSELMQVNLDVGKKAGHAICGGYVSGMFGFFFTEGPDYNFGFK